MFAPNPGIIEVKTGRAAPTALVEVGRSGSVPTLKAVPIGDPPAASPIAPRVLSKKDPSPFSSVFSIAGLTDEFISTKVFSVVTGF